MPLVPIQIRPGIIRDSTAYTTRGGWFDCDKIRFRLGMPESLGGWRKLLSEPVLGTVRAMHVWFTLTNQKRLAIGTSRKYYVEYGEALYDITPIREEAELDGPFSISDEPNVLTVTHTAHGASAGGFVIFSGAVGLGGNVTAEVLNQEHEIGEILTSDTYTIHLPVTADSSDTGNGGADVDASYLVFPGLDTQVGGEGWGAGGWGEDGWGEASSFAVATELALWSQDNFGQDLVFNIRNGPVYYWQSSLGLDTRAVLLSSLVGADSETPTIAMQVLVSDRDRHVIVFGANSGGSTAQDPMRIRFSNQEDPLIWVATATNTAGDLILGSGSRIVRAIETKREILVWTDAALYSMQFIGPPYTFGIQQISGKTSIAGFNSAAAVEDTVFWMGNGLFFSYSGQVQELPCPVKEYVFGNFNKGQYDKVFAGTNMEFGEVIWFYPSAASGECDRYVIFNYREQAWYYGTMDRTAWIDCCPEPYPVAADTDGYLYRHELGFDAGDEPMHSYIESSPVDITDGERFMFIRRVLPDLTFFDSASGAPTATMTFTAQDFAGAPLGKEQYVPAVRVATIPVEQFTKQVHIRLRGRSVRIRVESNQLQTRWTLGTPRMDVQADGRR
jgi:hypothetical protein